MLVYAGIDEAGYGPMLGPLTVGCTVFVFPNRKPGAGAPKMWEMLKTAVAKKLKGAKSRIAVDDSKKLKLPNSNLTKSGSKHPLIHLERGVLSFLHCLARQGAERHRNELGEVRSDRAFYDRIMRSSRNEIGGLRWYLGDAVELPVGNDRNMLRIASHSLERSLQAHEIQIEQMSCRLLTEPGFNELTSRLKSKAAANFHLIGKHIAEIYDRYGEHHPRIIVDRQSGRMHYRELLHTLFPEADIRIAVEEESFSRYELNRQAKRGMVITFAKGAEQKHLPVALASMLAKYTRELLMIRFNRFFNGYLPELKPTAGYVQDARRFLKDIDGVIRQIGLDREQLVRKW